MAEQNEQKYSKLAGNTLLIGVSQFSSKLLNFFVRPMLSYLMPSQSVMGVSTLASSCANLLIPLVSLGISNGVVRFGLDKNKDQTAVFTDSLVTILLGYAVLWLLFPVVRLVPKVSDYILLIYVYVLTSCLRTLCTQFISGRQWTKLLAVDGVLATVVTMAYYALFLAVFSMGPEGYLLSIICGDLTSSLFIFLVGRLYRYLDFGHFDKALWREMLVFSLPMIPAQISFWVINSSDTFIVSLLCEGWAGQSGDHWTGLLSAAYTLPSIVTTLGMIFYLSWQLSAVTEEEGREEFFSRVFHIYSGVMFCCCAGVIMLCRPLMVVFQSGYRAAWVLVPFLALAATCTCFNQFFNSVYVVYKKSVNSFYTMLAGAVLNVVLDVAFCLWFGPVGATVASFLGLGCVLALRLVDTRRLLKMRLRPARLAVNFGLIIVQAAWLLLGLPGATVGSVVLTAGVIAFNWGSVWQMAALLLPKLLGRRLGGRLAALLAPPSHRRGRH